MISPLPNIADMPHESATTVKNNLREMTKKVIKTGALAITNHSSVEVVMVEASAYQALLEQVQALEETKQPSLAALTERFDENLKNLQQPEAVNQVTAVLQSKGKSTNRPKAGNSY